jgi:Toprim-like
MTQTLPGADIRHYYAALGISLPTWASENASLRCFADPDAHHHGDRHASCSVNLATGAYNCHGCGAHGGAYDAALARGFDSRSAIELMIAHRLIQRRARGAGPSLRTPESRPGTPAASIDRQQLRVTERDVLRWQHALGRRPNLLEKLRNERAWAYSTMRELGVGWDRGRITIPIRNASSQLRGLLRYQPDEASRPKMLAAHGTRLGLVPHPSVERSKGIVLVEGPPDMIAARSRGIPALAVPGDHAWQEEWTELLVGRRVSVVMDADDQGRAAAERIANSLGRVAWPEILDIAPHRLDGYDVTDWLLANPEYRDEGRQ